MQHNAQKALTLATLLACTTLALADEPAAPAAAPAADAAKPAGPTLADILTNSGIDLKGYIDVAAEYSSLAKGGNPYKVFDTDHSGLNLHQIGLTVDKLPKEGFGGLINLTIGKDANVIKSYDTSSSNTYFDITQGFLQYAGGPFTVQAGKFATLAGAEVIDSSANSNFSRSILFGAIPFTHTGIRATYAADDTTNLIFGINNGWDQVQDYNTQKTIELGITANPVKPLTLAASIYSGVESVLAPGASTPGVTPQGNRTLVDAVVTYAASDALTLILNLDYVRQESWYANPNNTGSVDADYFGAALYVNYAIDETDRISFRAEELHDSNGFKSGTPGVGQGASEFTITYGYSPSKNFELRPELRFDQSTNALFYKTDDMPGTPTGKSGTTVALQGVYKF